MWYQLFAMRSPIRQRLVKQFVIRSSAHARKFPSPDPAPARSLAAFIGRDEKYVGFSRVECFKALLL